MQEGVQSTSMHRNTRSSHRMVCRHWWCAIQWGTHYVVLFHNSNYEAAGAKAKRVDMPDESFVEMIVECYFERLGELEDGKLD